MRVPPLVLEGGSQAKLMQSLKALTILGGAGEPGNAGNRKKNTFTFSRDKQLVIYYIKIWTEIRNLTQNASSNITSCHGVTEALRVFCPDPVAVLSATIYVSVSVGRLSRNVSNFSPGVSSQLLPLQVVISQWTTAIILWGPPFKINGRQRTFYNFYRSLWWGWSVWKNKKYIIYTVVVL